MKKILIGVIYWEFNNRDNEEYNDYRYNNKNPKKMVLFVAVGVIALIVVIFGGIFINKKIQISSLTSKAEKFVEMQDYDEAIKIYSELYTKTGDVEYKSKKNQMLLKKETKNILEEAKSNEQKGEYVKAIALYKQITEDDVDNYKLAKSKITSLKSDVLKKASALIDSGNNSSASTYLSDYLNNVPDDKDAVNLMKKITGKTETEIKQVVVTQPASTSSSGLNAAKATARNITDTYQYITSSEANLRVSPSKSSAVVGTLYKGSSVYVYSTYIESASRIWCKTDGGWISYNTMNYSIK